MPFDFKKYIRFENNKEILDLRGISASADELFYFLQNNPEIRFLQVTWEFVKRNKEINFFAKCDINKFEICAPDDEIIEVLATNPYIKHLIIRIYDLKFTTQRTWLALAKANLETIEISGVDDDGVEIVTKNEHIKHFTIVNKLPLTQRAWETMAGANLASVTVYKIDSNGVNALLKSKSIKCLTISGSTLPTLDPMAFADNTVLESLCFETCAVENDIVYAIAASNSITKLHIPRSYGLGSGIDPRGAKALSELSQLEDLDLSGNQIGDFGAQALAQSKSIKYLDLWRCGINRS